MFYTFKYYIAFTVFIIMLLNVVYDIINEQLQHILLKLILP